MVTTTKQMHNELQITALNNAWLHIFMHLLSCGYRLGRLGLHASSI